MTTREPLAVRAAIVAAVTAVLHVLVLLGALQLDAEAEAAIAGAVDLNGLAVVVVWTRTKVTPVDAPVLTAEQVQAGTIWPGTPDAGEDDEPRHMATDR